MKPNLVVLCVRIDDADGFQVLSMLTLDEETRGIPVITFTTQSRHDEEEDDSVESSDAEMFPAAKPAIWMN